MLFFTRPTSNLNPQATHASHLSPQSSNLPPLRILHAPWNVGGHPATLARAEREIGLQSHAVELLPGPFQFPIDETLCSPTMTTRVRERARLRLLWRAVRDFDIVHFNFGQTLLMGRVYPDRSLVEPPRTLQDRLFEIYWRRFWMWDLPLLKLFGKGIVMTYQGDDARQGDECRRRFAITAAHHVEAGYYTPVTDHWKRKAIGRVAAYADRIYALNPDLLHVLPPSARFLPYANVDLREWTPSRPTDHAVPVVIHTPTHTGVKGTSFVLRAVERLQREGVRFEFRIIQNLSQAEARKAYQQADLLVDQLLLGWYGGVAVECMALGKPVVCYLREEDLQLIPAAMRTSLPIINATPTTIYQVLKDLLTRRVGELATIGRRSRAYVEAWHDPRAIARMLAEEYAAIAGRAVPAVSEAVQTVRSKPPLRAHHG